MECTVADIVAAFLVTGLQPWREEYINAKKGKACAVGALYVQRNNVDWKHAGRLVLERISKWRCADDFLTGVDVGFTYGTMGAFRVETKARLDGYAVGLSAAKAVFGGGM